MSNRRNGRSDIIDILSRKLQNKNKEMISESERNPGYRDSIRPSFRRNGLYGFGAVPLKDNYSGSFATFGIGGSTEVGK
ncbi:MAG: hypothetical protein J7L15_03505 [Clostridiales bacterium]|nr:hypothetical protein [Clostridiales bacterium]